MFSLSMMTVRMEIEHVFLKEEIPESPVFPLLVNDFQFFPCFDHHNEGQPFTMGNVGVQVIRRRQSGEDRKFIYFPHALPAVKVSPRFLTER